MTEHTDRIESLDLKKRLEAIATAQDINTPISSSNNNGGKTSYYDVPPESSTLNDLVEYKQMYCFQYEIFKASYALKERATRATDGTSSLERELNKIIYYAERGKVLLSKGAIK